MAIIDDYAEIGKRYRALTERWIPSPTEQKTVILPYPTLYIMAPNYVRSRIGQLIESSAEVKSEPPTFDPHTGEVMKGGVSVSAEVRDIVERIKRNTHQGK